jgi:hypothetical protein
MPKFTVREFCVAMGLEQDGTDYIGAITLLKTLVKHGAAKEAGKVNASRLGRKSIVYDLPDPIVLPIPQMVNVPATLPKAPEPVVAPVVEEVVEEQVEEVVDQAEVAVAAGPVSEYTYDFGDEDED